jgi:hypothetical protein
MDQNTVCTSLTSAHLLDKRSLLIFQRLQLDKTSQADPLTLLEKISRNGISQDVCINDLGMNLQRYTSLLSFPPFQNTFFFFCSFYGFLLSD